VTTEESKLLNEAIFEKLAADTPETRRAADALNSYTRSLMYHRFTGMPKRGFMHQIMPAKALHPLAHWDRLGVPRSELEGPVTCGAATGLYSWVLDGPLFYEIAERRLAREDFDRRLAARQVQRWEWESHAKLQRSLKRTYARGLTRLTLDQQEERAYQIMGELVALLRSIPEKETP